MSDVWQYTTATNPTEAELKRWGEEGWEAYSVETLPATELYVRRRGDDTTTLKIYHFKRRTP